MPNRTIVPGSFRDPSGFVFLCDGKLYRQVQLSYKEHYESLMASGLYKRLVQDGQLVSHQEVSVRGDDSNEYYKTIEPQRIPFISYPYEWSFSQLKDAALMTLEIQKKALQYGMSLVDCSAFNVQFCSGRPIFIDTLSFRRLKVGEPWIAYRQFCQHFLAPLALMSLKDIRLGQLLRIYLDGIPLDLASSLLPLKSRRRLPLLLHIHLHARSQRRYENKTIKLGGRKISQRALLGIIDSLESGISGLSWNPRRTEWIDYYQETNYSPAGLVHKRELVAAYIREAGPKVLWDLGANVGDFSRIAACAGALTVSFDIDPACVERLYRQCKDRGETSILPLLSDLTNPSPAIGWESRERMSLVERAPADAVMALALVHHVCISNNVPLLKAARFLSRLAPFLIIEFVPKEDSQVQRLLATRDDIFPNYDQAHFEGSFRTFFRIKRSAEIRDSKRTMYLMEALGG